MSSVQDNSIAAKKMVVVEYHKVLGTYLELGFWDEDIGAERYAELLAEARIREEDYLRFDGNQLVIKDKPDLKISLKNETIFRCLCSPDLENCGACFMRKRTVFAEGQYLLSCVKATKAHEQALQLSGANETLEAQLAEERARAEAKEEELRSTRAQLEKLKGYVAAQLGDRVQSLGRDHPFHRFLRDVDEFAATQQRSRAAQPSALACHAEAGDEPEPDSESDADDEGAGTPSESSNDSDEPGDDGSDHGGNDYRDPTGGDSEEDNHSEHGHDSGYYGGDTSRTPEDGERAADADDEDVHRGLAGKRRRASSAGPSDAPSPPAKRRRVSTARSELSAPAEPAKKPFKRQSFNSRCAELDFSDPSALSSLVEDSQLHKTAGPSTPSQMAGPSTFSQQAGPASDTDTDTYTVAAGPSSPERKSESPERDADVTPAERRPTARSWSEHEKSCLIDVVRSHLTAVQEGKRKAIHDVGLWSIISDQMTARGFDRGAQACRMTWNRGLRASSGLDERLRPDPARMATSIQGKKE